MDEYTTLYQTMSDKDIVDVVTKWDKECVGWHEEMLQKQNRCVDYYHGKQTEMGYLPPHASKSVYNRLFEAVETVIPVVTGGAHLFLAAPSEDTPISRERSHKLQEVLMRKYEDLEIVKILENADRDMMLKRFGVIKWYWNPATNDVDVKVVDPRLIRIPKLKMDAHDLPYVIELQDYDISEMNMYFPDSDEKLWVKKKMDNGSLTETYQVKEVWTNEYVVWIHENEVLKRMANPYFDFEGNEESTVDTDANGKIKVRKYLKFYNHLDFPQKPYVFLTPFTTGDAPVAEISLAEIAMPIQDDINTSKRQILDNLKFLGNGQVYVDADVAEEEVIDNLTNEPGLVIVGNGVASENKIRREQAVPLPATHFQNLMDSIGAFDNVFGVHKAVRGESQGNVTLGGQMMNRQQDLSRIEQLTRINNRAIARLADGIVQMMKMYYTEDHVFKILGRDGAFMFIQFNRNDIEEGTAINVKSGTPPVLDPVARYNQAIQLWQLQALDPETLFERLEFANPRQAAEKLLLWKQGQLMMEAQAAQMGAAPQEGAPRDVETDANVVQRAERDLSGQGAAPLTNTPNQ